jgi:diguanylate cyclase
MMDSTSLQILLIDDDELDRQAVVRSLKKSQIECDIFQSSTALEGLKIASKQHFDAVLLDYRLPDLNGLEVLKQLRGGEFESVAVIMLSHQEDDRLIEQCLDAGAQDFMIKSEVSSRQLVRAVKQAKQRYQIETDLRASREQLRLLSEHDPLTGLANRRGFEMAMERAIAHARRRNTGLGVLLLDLDDFKSINDTLGHDAGDQLLIKISTRIGTIVRDSDLLCRLGGDEFVVLMTDLEHNEQAALLANRILSEFRQPIHIGSAERLITTSIGIAIRDRCSEFNENPVDLLKCADVAMYQAKRNGRNQSFFYSEPLQKIVHFRAKLKNDMHKALERGEFKVYYQAQFKTLDRQLSGFEALLRWHHPGLGILAPDTFLPIAEESQLIVNIGYWVLHQACKQLKQWQQQFPALTMAVNLSAVQIKQDSLLDECKNALTANQLNGHSLEFEITESALIEDASETVAVLSLLTEQGVILSLDDFGTGYSSLEHLKLFPISVLKIDKGFIASIGANSNDERLLIAIIAFAKALNMKIVAEGVETKEQVDFCFRNGCDLIQGYYFSRPLLAEEIGSIEGLANRFM